MSTPTLDGAVQPGMTLAQMARTALARPAQRAALCFENHWHDWSELRRLTLRIDALLRASGAPPQAPVSLIARNQPEAVAALLGLIASGRSVRMIYSFQSGEGMARDLQRFGSPVVMAAARDFSAAVRAVLQEQGAAAIAMENMDALALPGFERCPPCPAQDPLPPQIQIHTSGTTGAPKPFAVSQELLARHHVAPRLAPEREAQIAQEAPALLFFPIGNITGIYAMLPALLRGQRALLLERFSLDAWRAYVREYQPTMGGGPPAVIQMILDAQPPREELGPMRYFGTGAAPLDPALQRRFEQQYGIAVLLSYGATEFAGPVCAMSAELHAQWGEAKFGSVGRPLPGASLRIVDAQTDAPLPPGQEGLLEVISPRLPPEWIRTSDLGVIDEDGFLFLRGRADGAIMRGGFKLLPETIERALLQHEAIAEAAVVGVSDARLGQVPAAALRLKADAPEPGIAELESHLRRLLLATHLPVHWRFVTQLPRNPSLKIDRRALRELFENL
ncbi:Acyl-CoA synthetase (AMP-forming)/AMP-acid ligase II [Solimonas aquatica]|uniref:Acyl-CoA synthetase (AMP-forming)/AMP-acid ligase II n=1 Tax=Solimonas aquatica TaxID=489703 RepID=A0A1H9BL12_9GAMM|nr:fatty acid--CoA ligase family protein [Solimonas aquatica]SEP89664.1 Acyl-CoA synthetase (AMP-forming)/AMP-acid ligase II [Solimonas aquatica]